MMTGKTDETETNVYGSICTMIDDTLIHYLEGTYIDMK